jgi:hypothetical protein
MSASVPLPDLQFRLLDWEPHPKPELVPDPPAVDNGGGSGQRDDVRRLRASLEAAVASKVMSASELIRAVARQRRDEVIPTTLVPFDELLGGGLARGRMIELAGRQSSGRFSIVMAALTAATSMGEAAVLVDLGDHFDPQLAEANGVDLRRLLWVRPRIMKQAVMAVEMLAAAGFQLVALDAGQHPIRGRRVPDASWVRLGRTAETHGAAMLISTPYPLTGTASEAVVAARRGTAEWSGRGRGPRVLAGTTIELTLEKHRQLRPGRTSVLVLSSQFSVPGSRKNHEPTTGHRQTAVTANRESRAESRFRHPEPPEPRERVAGWER